MRSIHSTSSLNLVFCELQFYSGLNIWFFTKPKTKKKAVMVKQVLSSYNYFSKEKTFKLHHNYEQFLLHTCGKNVKIDADAVLK